MRAQHFYPEFEFLCARVLADMNFDVRQNVRLQTNSRIREVDILATQNGRKHAVEVKWSRYENVDLQRLRDWAAKTAGLLSDTDTPILIVSGRVEKARKQWAEQEYRIQIWDRDFLLVSARSADLVSRLQVFFRESDNANQEREGQKVNIASEQTDKFEEEQFERSPVAPTADELISLLDGIKPGKSKAKQYEDCCQVIIDYLFGQHLVEPRPQQRLEDKLSYLDIVFRVSPLHPVWKTLTRDFRARVVVFECKGASSSLYDGAVHECGRVATNLFCT